MATTEEELASAHLCRSGSERQKGLARDAEMDEARLNDDRFHIAREERQRRWDRYVAMNEDELNFDHLNREWKETEIRKPRIIVISQKCGNTYEASLMETQRQNLNSYAVSTDDFVSHHNRSFSRAYIIIGISWFGNRWKLFWYVTGCTITCEEAQQHIS